jgi:hypothetical protein
MIEDKTGSKRREESCVLFIGCGVYTIGFERLLCGVAEFSRT